MGSTLKFPKKTIHDLPLDGKVVLVRVDYNVPLDKDGKITDDFRIKASLPMIRHLKRHKCKIILCSHLGRPDGKRVAKYSLEPVAKRLVELLKEPVKFVDDCVGDKVRQSSKHLHSGEVLLLENLRFHPGEETNDMTFAKEIKKSTGAEYFVQDGFGTIHRAHATYVAMPQILPAAAGDLLKREYLAITSAMKRAKPPLVAILGGAKVSDKVGVIEKLIPKADTIIIGGAMANNFLHYKKGLNVGKSKIEPDVGPIIDKIYQVAAKKTANVDDLIILPTDVAVAKSLDSAEGRREVAVDEVADDDLILDIGSQSIERMASEIAKSSTVIWNGTLGVAEKEQYSYGSSRAALEVARRDDDITSLVGGGDTADFVIDWSGGGQGFDHISTGGGASIALMAGEELPGFEVLLDA